jgi:2-methylcitrate dehydratase PrpD
VTYPRGEPENPLSDDEMAAKFEKNASTLYTVERVNRMRAIILDIENRRVRELTSMLRAPGSS